MVFDAGARTRIVYSAIDAALDTPLLADIEWEGQGVFGHVGLQTVGAEAAISEGFRIASVGQDHTRSSLLANDGAVAQLVVAPGLPSVHVDARGVDVVVGGNEEGAGERQEGSSEGNHCRGCLVRGSNIR